MNKQLIKKSLLCNWDNNEELSRIINTFKDKVEIRFVGGCIRDILLGLKLKDIDFAINCKPNQTIKILKEKNTKYSEKGISHGSISIEMNEKKYEITSLRKDVITSGRFAKVEYTNDWDEDSLRRDFTMNAIYLSITGEITDKFNGINDINDQKISFIGETKKRIQEDYLRILRYFRIFGIFYNPKYQKKDIEIIDSEINEIKKFVSNNKINNELIKMMGNSYFSKSFLIKFKSNQNKNLLEIIENWWNKDKYIKGLETILLCKKLINRD